MTTTMTIDQLRRAAAQAETNRARARDMITAARIRKEAAYDAYLQAHRARRELGESRAALASPLQDTSAQDTEFNEANAAFRTLIRDIYRSHLMRPADLLEAAQITRQRLHQINQSTN